MRGARYHIERERELFEKNMEFSQSYHKDDKTIHTIRDMSENIKFRK